MRETFTAIVLAAGSGRRMNSDVPKQYMELCGYPVLYYSLRAFAESAVDSIVLVTGAEDVAYCRHEIVEKYNLDKISAIVPGGSERYLSVYEGLKACHCTDYVLIHDGARPLLSAEEIARSMEMVRREKACVLAVPVKDTIRIAEDGYAAETLRRDSLWAMQTPQSFSYSLLMDAYHVLFEKLAGGKAPAITDDAMIAGGKAPAITDDAMIVEYATDRKIRLLPGGYRNIKITTPEDLLIAKAFLEQE